MTAKGVSPQADARDAADDLRVLLLTAGVVLTAFAIGSALQAVFVFRPERLELEELLAQTPRLPARLLANLAAVAAVLLLCAVTRLTRRRPIAVLALTVAIAASVAAGRHALQILFGIYHDPAPEVTAVETLSVAAVILLSVTLGLIHVRTRVSLRQRVRAETSHRLRASAALADLASEEIRVRRDVADGLHTSLQGRLVMVEAGIAELARRAHGRGDAAEAARLHELRVDLGEIRERDVRELSHLLYPVGVDVSVDHALRSLIRRVPADIDIRAEVSPDADEALRAVDEQSATVARRIALIRAAEEGIANALRHGAASSVRIAVDVTKPNGDTRVGITVDDDGVGPPDDPRWSGLARMADRLGVAGGTVDLRRSPLGGARLRVEIPGG